MSDQMPLPRGAIWLLVFLIIGVVIWQVNNGSIVSKIKGFGMEVEFESNNSPSVKAPLVHENLLVSDYHEMYLDERNLFGASIALDDSIKEALNELPTGNIITNRGITPTYGNSQNATVSSTNESMLFGTRVDLSGPTFDIEPATSVTSEAQDIPTNNPHHNFAMWKWLVIPREEGPHTLFIEAYTVDDEGHRKSIDSTKREINVVVKSAPPIAAEETAPAAENVTAMPPEAAAAFLNTTEKPSVMISPAANVTAEAAPAVVVAPVAETAPAAENKTAAAPAAEKAAPVVENKNVTASAKAEGEKAQPGFEGIFAISGLLAVAYLVLGRKH